MRAPHSVIGAISPPASTTYGPNGAVLPVEATTTTPKPVTNADLAKANSDYHARITREEMEAIKARYRCQLGIQIYCGR